MVFDIEVDGNDVHEVLVDETIHRCVSRHISDVVFVGEDDPCGRVVLAFARSLVSLTLVVLVVTLTVVGAWCVGAVLRANAWGFQTLINISTGFPVRHQFVSLVAVAVVSSQGVNAFVSALVYFKFRAFIDVAVSGLVRLVRAVGHFVANESAVNTLIVVTLELVRWTGLILFDAPNFIRVVAAIVLTVASEVVSNTLKVLALEFLVGTLFVESVAAFAFVRAVAAVVVVVAKPAFVDASAVGALELVWGARRRRSAVMYCRVLIGSVDTIWIAIAQPLSRYTLSASPEFVLLARVLGLGVTLAFVTLVAVVLITVIEAIVVSIADVDSRYAVAVVASKEVAEAGSSLGAAVFWRLVSSIATVVVAVAVPRSGYTPVVRAAEAVLRARSLRAMEGVLVRVVAAVVIAVAEPVRLHADVGLLTLQVVSGASGVRRA